MLRAAAEAETDQHIYAVLMDADGCFYNSVFETILLRVIARHGQRLDRMWQSILVLPESSDFAADLKKEMEEIYDEVSDFIVLLTEHYDKQYEQSGSVSISQSVYDSMMDSFSYIYPKVTAPNLIKSMIKLHFIKILNAFQKKDTSLYQIILIAANRPWLNIIEPQAKLPGCIKMLMFSASNRQSFAIEQVNAVNNGTGYFCVDLFNLVRLIEESVNCESQSLVKCEHQPFMMADLYHDRSSGSAFNLISQHVLSGNTNLSHDTYVFDETKFTLLYAIIHFLAIQYPTTKLRLAFFDDRHDIHHAVSTIFQKYSELIPEHMEIAFWHYEGKKMDKPYAVVNGTGKFVDCLYQRNIKLLLELCGYQSNQFPVSVDVAARILEDPSIIEKFLAVRSSVNPEIALCQYAASQMTLFSRSPSPILPVKDDAPALAATVPKQP